MPRYATTLNATGIDYVTYFDAYFTIKSAENDVDRKGNVISGTKKKKVTDYINKLILSKVQKAILLASAGTASAKALNAK